LAHLPTVTDTFANSHLHVCQLSVAFLPTMLQQILPTVSGIFTNNVTSNFANIKQFLFIIKCQLRDLKTGSGLKKNVSSILANLTKPFYAIKTLQD
jgi:hypothetical protein